MSVVMTHAGIRAPAQLPEATRHLPEPVQPPSSSQEHGASGAGGQRGWACPHAALDRAPLPTANIIIFRPSSFFILVHTGLGLQLEVQLVPLMQVFLRLDPAYRGQMCGEAGRGPEGLGQDPGCGFKQRVQRVAGGGDWGGSSSEGTR